MLGPGGHRPPNLAQVPQIFRVITVHKLLNILDNWTQYSSARCCLPNDEGPGPQIFFPRTAPTAPEWKGRGALRPAVIISMLLLNKSVISKLYFTYYISISNSDGYDLES